MNTNDDNHRDILKQDFKYYLEHVVKSSRRTEQGFNLGGTAVGSYLSFIEDTKRLFDYNPSKWAHIESMYDITDPDEAKRIVDEVLNDPIFVKRDKDNNQMFRSGALMHYVCFLYARTYFGNDKDKIAYNGVNISSDLPLQQIYYGAPGTGKSYEINAKTKGHAVVRTTFHPDSDYSTFVGSYKPQMAKNNYDQVIHDYDSLVDKFKEYIAQKGNMTVASTMIGYDYHDSIVDMQPQHSVADLVADAYKSNTTYDSVVRGGMAVYESSPKIESSSKIVYKYTKQAFLKAYLSAWRKYAESRMTINPTSPEPQFLVIEEINRGNCAQIFGDLFQLLDREDNGFSSYPIEADTDLQQEVANAFSEEEEYMIPAEINVDDAVEDYTSNYGATLSEDIINGRVLLLPPNLYIWATMNTSDQSLFPIDSAFKRRWDWKYMPINTAKESWAIDVDGTRYSWTSFLNKINSEISETTSSEDKQLGFYFCKADKINENDNENENRDENGNHKKTIITCEKFVSKVLFYLYNDVFKDYGLERDFFKDIDNNNKIISFQSLYNYDGTVNYETVLKLLTNLKVEPGKDFEANPDKNRVDDEELANPSEMSTMKTKRKEYWAAFLDYANKNNEKYAKYFSGRKTPSTDKWYNFFFNQKDCHFCVEQTRTRNELAIELYFEETTDKYYKLLAKKDDIEVELNMHFEWREMPEKKASNIVEILKDVDFEDKSKWKEQFEYIIDRLVRMREVFKKYIDQL